MFTLNNNYSVAVATECLRRGSMCPYNAIFRLAGRDAATVGGTTEV